MRLHPRVKIASGKPSANDCFGLADRIYYSKDFPNADSTFSRIISQPDFYLFVIYEGKANVGSIPKNEKWAAKELYELFISKVKPEEKRKE